MFVLFEHTDDARAGDLPKRGSFAHLLHSLSHLHLLPKRGSRVSLHSDERQDGEGAAAGAGASGEHDEQREAARARFDAQHHHGARHGGKELRKSKSQQEFGSVLKNTPELDVGISISAHAPSATASAAAAADSAPNESINKAAPSDVEPERSEGAFFSLGGAQLGTRVQPHAAEAAVANDTGFEMRSLSATAQVEMSPGAKFEDTQLPSSIRRRPAPQ